MTFEDVLDQAVALLQRRGRVTYHTLQRQFHLDDDALNDLKEALLYTYAQVYDDVGRALLWSSDVDTTSLEPTPASRVPRSGPHWRIRQPIWPSRFSPPAVSWKVSANR